MSTEIAIRVDTTGISGLWVSSGFAGVADTPADKYHDILIYKNLSYSNFTNILPHTHNMIAM